MTVDDWGLVPYREAWERQRRLRDALVADPEVGEHIVMVEHPPVYTLGFHGDARNMLASEESLRLRGAECIRIERGGDVTYHGPGQLVVYPILSLHRHRLGVKAYIERLESAVIELCARYGVTATTAPGAIGVWIGWGTPSARKICAIGVKVSHGVTMHGLALNVNTDLSAFSLINPCGFKDKGVASLAAETGHPCDMRDVKSRMAEILLEKLD